MILPAYTAYHTPTLDLVVMGHDTLSWGFQYPNVVPSVSFCNSLNETKLHTSMKRR
jgi:hypothetical protein